MTRTLQTFLMWLALFALAAANGALREFVLRPALGSAALPLSGGLLIAIHLIAIFLFVRALMPAPQTALLIGAAWLVLTLGAEALLTLRAGLPASDVLDAMTWQSVRGGNLVALAYLSVLLSPAILAHLLRRPA